MDILDFVQQQFISLHQRFDLVMQGISEAQINWEPPGLSNSIGATFLHMSSAEDFHIQVILQNKPRLWESGGWSRRFDLEFPPGGGQHWEETKGKAFEIAVLADYQKTVRAATAALLADLTALRLNEQVIYFGEEKSIANVLNTLVIHLAGHAGEIAALRGIQGEKGFPF